MARRRGQPKKAKPVIEWERLGLVEKDVAAIIEKDHHHLERATIIVIGKPGKVGTCPCNDVVKLRTPTNAERAFAKHEGWELHYVVEVKRDPYFKLPPEGRKRRLDHALCHAAGQDERGRWIFEKRHDVEEFASILKRHGAPNDNAAFGLMAQQMALFARASK